MCFMQIEISPDFSIKYSLAGNGAPIILLHAFPLNEEMWELQTLALQREYSVIALNARGFGNTSPFTSTPSLAQMVRDLNDFLNAMKFVEPIRPLA